MGAVDADVQEIPLMYLADAKIIWNGNTVSPNPIAISPFLDTLPLSRHDLQSLDCHPMPGMYNTVLAYRDEQLSRGGILINSTCRCGTCTRYPADGNWVGATWSIHHQQFIE